MNSKSYNQNEPVCTWRNGQSLSVENCPLSLLSLFKLAISYSERHVIQVQCDCQSGKAIEASIKPDQSQPEDYDFTVDYTVDDQAKWASWSPWGQCNRSCGDGEQTRVRSCEGGAVGQGSCHQNRWKGTLA